MGPSVAREMILLGAELDAARALAVGLVSEVVPIHALRARALELAEAVAGLDREAVAAAKEALGRAGDPDHGRTFVQEMQARFYGRNRRGDG